MGLPFINGAAKKRDQLIAIDLGGRTTKAVHLQRNGQGLVLTRYAIQDAPIYEKSLSPELLADHLRGVCQALETKTHAVVLAVGVVDSVVRHAELPVMPVPDMRQVLKNNTKNYLQQDLPGYIFDCFAIATRAPQKPTDNSKTGAIVAKQRVLVAGAKKQLLEDVQTAVRSAGLMAEQIVPGLIGPVNAFEMALPEVFAHENVALVDIGYHHTTICLLQEGQLVLSRVVGLGGDKITNGLAETMGISYAEAEGIKLGMPGEVQAQLESLLAPLGRELRASIDFFEHQQDKAVGHIYIGGASSRSELLLQVLQAELMAECKPWNPLGFLTQALPPQQTAEIEQVAPQLAVAVGAALAAF